MSRILEQASVRAVEEALGCELSSTPAWLQRPGRSECGERWELIRHTYSELTRRQLPEQMPSRERRTVDAVLKLPGHPPRIFEFDESQHFNRHRAVTLRLYPNDIDVAFPVDTWLRASETSRRKLSTTGGWGKAKPPLFPEAGGRHLQRAFRDALADLLPSVHGWAPTLRLADFEVEDWIHGPDMATRMRGLLDGRLAV
jgi:hypothetical protein